MIHELEQRLDFGQLNDLAIEQLLLGAKDHDQVESCLVISAWGFDDSEHDEEVDELPNQPPWGAVVGCSDGSIYVFRPDLSKHTRRKSTLKKRRSSDAFLLSPNYRIPPHLSLARSRNTSPMGSRTNLTLTSSKSRAVSGLSKEQVEAPKNFVDFEDEQERMKGMISDRSVKDVKDRSPRTSFSAAPNHHDPHSRRLLDDTRSITSVESSSTVLSPPISPTLDPRNTRVLRKHLVLRTRIMPRNFGSDHSIVALHAIEDGTLFLSLQGSGKVYLFKSADGYCVICTEPGPVPHTLRTLAVSQGTGSQLLWRWTALHVAQISDAILVVAIGKANDSTVALDGGKADDKTRVAIYELTNANGYEFGETTLSKIGDFVFEGRAEGFTVHHDEIVKLYQVNGDSILVERSLEVLPRSIVIPLASTSRHDSQSPPRITIQSTTELGKLNLTGDVGGFNLRRRNKTLSGLLWSSDELLAFTIHNSRIKMRSVIPVQASLVHAELLDEHDVQLVSSDRVDTYSLPDVATNESDESVKVKPVHTTTTLLSSLPLPRRTLVCSTRHRSQRRLILTIGADNQQITVLSQSASNGASKDRRSAIWSKSKSARPENSSARRMTAVLPIELETIVVAYDDGHLNKVSINELVGFSGNKSSSSGDDLGCAILCLSFVRHFRTGQRFIAGGGDDGSVLFWDLATLELKGRWVVFTEPLAQVVYLEDENAGRLRGCCLCVSGDGTIAVISVDGFNFLYLIPGSPTPLQTICLGSDNLLLSYADSRMRVWDVKAGELRRSMSSDKAAEMLTEGGWFVADLDKSYGASKSSPFALNKSTAQGDPPPASIFDVGAILESYVRSGGTKSSGQVTPDHLKALLTVLHTSGFDEHADRLLLDLLATRTFGNNSASSENFDGESFQFFCFESFATPWQISPEVTATRLLTTVAFLSALSTAEGYETPANSLLSFYTVSLPLLVGVAYQTPSLAVLAHFWSESTGDIRSAAKQLFENEISRLPDEDISLVAEKWRHKLPCLLPEDQRQSDKAALALSICGNIAIERYTLLSPTTLSDVAKSVTLYFHDDTSPHRVLAIDLCSRGFEIWQQHFDAMEALRSLFVLATTSRKESVSTKNPGPYARMAVLQIASSNSPLFVTTLSLDILHPRSIDYNKSVLQIIAFLIRKKPLVLFPNLPRLMEAVVKSLDPVHNAEREAVLDSVTEIIALVVQTFPTLDFHSGSQRLAVGTSEGAVIMYDLKTATRLYVLEGHRKRLTGISFSPDGRRMVTLSVEERVLLVWKVGSSFTSFFYPGAPPRQGRSGSEPYKALSFVLQGNAVLTLEESLTLVSFVWPSDRSVRVQIRDAVFTFST